MDGYVVSELQTVGCLDYGFVAEVIVSVVDNDSEGVVNLVCQDVVEEYTCAHGAFATEVD